MIADRAVKRALSRFLIAAVVRMLALIVTFLTADQADTLVRVNMVSLVVILIVFVVFRIFPRSRIRRVFFRCRRLIVGLGSEPITSSLEK